MLLLRERNISITIYLKPDLRLYCAQPLQSGEAQQGGSGLFRPEVLRPIGIKDNVIAWGLGLERLAMLYYTVSSIIRMYTYCTEPCISIRQDGDLHKTR